MRPARWAAFLLVLLLTGCAGGSSSPSRSPSSSAPPSTAVSPTSTARGVADWTTYHGDAARSGVLRGAPLTGFQPAVTHQDWQTGQLDGDVYASPIVASGLVVVATENDTVYAFDATAGGQAKQVWKRHLAEPVDASTLPCGGIRPVSGITSTPVADPGRDVLYVVGFVRPAQHLLFTLKLSTGDLQGSRPVDASGESPRTHQQRGALALANGYVYIPFGGLLGDCGQYHGRVLGVPVDGGDLIQYQTSCSRECAIWAPGGPTVDGSGDIWVATGNGEPFDRFTAGNAVLRLPPGLGKPRDYFAPSDWAELSRSDQDLGSISPILLDHGLVWISGKGSTGYLLRQEHLGGVGGQAFKGDVCPSFASAIASGDVVFVTCPEDGRLMALRVDAGRPSFSQAWQAQRNAPGAPILAFGALWVIDTGDGSLAALDPGNGNTTLFSLPGHGATPHFVTPAAASGHIYAALGRRLVAVSTGSSG
ncbi:MAG: PQQ-binding-like beta-propeller repeat protein [Candidatus Dormibacteraeota bacterium]|nr:PQQ-binding-like beta-propeller repeat protein [Candidatus Dormibacteraeota bacterium]